MLYITHYRLTFSHPQPTKDNYYPGSAWRGAFGHALKQRDASAYSYLFETPLIQIGNASAILHGSHAPHPFVISPAGTRPETDSGEHVTEIDLILMGRAISHANLAVEALTTAAKSGIYHVPYQLRHISCFHPAQGWQSGGNASPISIFDAPPQKAETASLCFVHPLRFKSHQNGAHLQGVLADELCGTLVRRYKQLEGCHDSPWVAPDYRELFSACRQTQIADQRLDWYEWSRYSNRQRKHVPMGGFIGDIMLEGRGLFTLWPYLWLGQWLHLGKGSVMGMGRYFCLNEPDNTNKK